MKNSNSSAPKLSDKTANPADWELLFRNAPAPLLTFDASSMALVAANDAAVRAYGYDRDQFLRLTAADLQPGTESVHAGSFLHRLADGSLSRVEVATSCTSWGGRAACIASVSFIGKFCSQEDEKSALREQQHLFAGVLETAMDAIITIDQRQRIQMFNESAALMFGVAADEVIGQALDRFLPLRSRDRHRGFVNQFALDGVTIRRKGVALSSLMALRSNGEEFPIEAAISKVHTRQGCLMTVAIRDLTRIQEVEAARRAHLQAEAASKAKSSFLSKMSHELRTPLNAVLGFAQLLDASVQPPLSQEQQGHVRQITNGGWHLLALINDVLDLAHIESGHMSVNLEPVLLNEVVREAVEMVAPTAAAAEVTIDSSVARRPKWVHGDAMRIRQVLLNVLSNAIKYNRAGGRIDVALSSADNEVSVAVSDNGWGMSREQVLHLFEPFNRLGRNTSAVPGTGIGLFISKQLLELMDGHMSVASQEGAGTTVTIALPVELHKDSAFTPLFDREAHDDEAHEQEVVASEGQPSGTVLYVEDEDVNFMLVEAMLASWPEVRLVRAGTVQQGLELAQQLTPELVLLDMRLPDGSGLDALHALRNHEHTRNLKVVCLSASAMPDEVAAALGAGANDYWTKPLGFKPFLRRTAALLPVA